MDPAALAALGFVTAGLGALGGLGGAVILVPVLVLAGVEVADAAPLGLLSVAAGSLAAAGPQLEERTVNHRLGVVMELGATAGALAGALVSGTVGEEVLTLALAAVALVAAGLGVARRGVRNLPDPDLGPDAVGERPGSLAGAYPLDGMVVPYAPRRVGAGLLAMGVSGVMAGMAGASGGFLKTPAMSELMHVPVKVSAATTTFTIGVTSAAGLVVFALQGRIQAVPSAAVVLGSLAGARLGASLQALLPPPLVRRGLSVALAAVALALVVAR